MCEGFAYYGPADATATPSSPASFKIQTGLNVPVPAYPGVLEKAAVKRVSVYQEVLTSGFIALL